MQEIIDTFAGVICAAARDATPVCIRGGGSKDFYGNAPRGAVLATGAYRGIVAYDPTELVITARCGTPLAELEAVLLENKQMLAFEPPHFAGWRSFDTSGSGAEGRDAAATISTLGGCVAAGLSGPRRASAGAVRDFVLGVSMLDGRGEELRFGGRVMKNVAGYDVSRLVAGSMGTLGLILDVSLKVLPRPATETTLRLSMAQGEAIAAMNRWAAQPLPISATCHEGNTLTIRLSGSEAALRAAQRTIGGEQVGDTEAFWLGLRDHTLAFFSGALPVWRLSVKSTAPPLNLPGAQLVEWGGALRWLKSAADPELVREAARAYGGHAILFRAEDKPAGAFQPLAPAMLEIHRRLKQAFDPARVLNPGRMYAGL
jgi:glycolate oxidase FAD binding subunit